MDSNSGTVSDVDTKIDVNRLSKFIGGKNALVAQGGGQRGIFTAGVFDAFNLANFDPFDEFYGTSAGALNINAFLCRQHGLGKAFITELTTDPNFFHLFSYIRRKNYMNLDWALEKICEYPYQMDLDMGRRVLGDRKALAAVTSSLTLRDEYFPMLGTNWRDVMRATCAIPRLYPQKIELDGQLYIDGGVSASIPVQEAWRRAARFIAVIRTEVIDAEPSLIMPPLEKQEEVKWFRDSLNSIQTQWQSRLENWKQDWKSFLQQQIARSKILKSENLHLQTLNGGRWLFGADDIYRVSHLLGEKFDAGLADMLMVHYQTYSLTREFLNAPPDDAFIIQIVPEKPLKSSSLMSTKEDLLHDYELGLRAGNRFIDVFMQADSIRAVRAIRADFSSLGEQ